MNTIKKSAKIWLQFEAKNIKSNPYNVYNFQLKSIEDP